MLEIRQGDCRELMAAMPEGSVQCVVTSPPYWGLRDYGLPPLDWGDWRGSLGLEPTPELYLEHLVEVFRAVRWVLRDDGTVWLNMGDAYSGGGRGGNPADSPHQKQATNTGSLSVQNQRRNPAKPGDLLGMPWRVAFALQADGWYLRSAIVWAKGLSFCDSYSGSVMPESVNGWRWERCKIKTGRRPQAQGKYAAFKHGLSRQANCPEGALTASWADCPGCEKCSDTDGYVLRKGSWRPTTAYEMVFLLAKSKVYFGDAEAVREAGAIAAGTLAAKGSAERKAVEGVNARPAEYAEYSGQRNLRNVWAIGPQPFPEAHFATFPEALVEPCIRAGTSSRACSVCGAPWAPVVEIERSRQSGSGRSGNAPTGKSGPGLQGGGATGDVRNGPCVSSTVSGYRPTCAHEDGEGRCLVLDPFSGAGTVGVVCKRLERNLLGLELSEEYCQMARNRISADQTLELWR